MSPENSIAIESISKSEDDTLVALLALQQSRIMHLQTRFSEADADALHYGEELDVAEANIQELLRYITDKNLICNAVDAFRGNIRLSNLIEPYCEEYLKNQTPKETN